MELPEVGTVAFVIALVAFFSTQFNLKGNVALACAFVVALAFGLAPILADMFPQVAPFLAVIGNTILLTITAAGSYDFVTALIKKTGTSPKG